MILKLINNNKLLHADILYYIQNYILYEMDNTKANANHNDLCLQNMIELLQTKSKETLHDNKCFQLINNNLSNEMETYKECLQMLTEEINIINSIFNDQNEVQLHTDIQPIIFEITIKSESGIRLYISFLCALNYPIKSCVMSKIYLCGPPTFATDSEIWQLQFAMQKQSSSSIGETHLFDIIQIANDWMNTHDTSYKHGGYMSFVNPYQELRVSLGVMDVCHSKYQKYLGLQRAMFVVEYLHFMNSSEFETNENRLFQPHNSKKRYVWLWKDNENNHVEFPPKLSQRINGLQVSDIFSFHIRDYQYSIHKNSESTAIQKNIESGTQRQCYRKQTKKFVKNWDDNKPQQIHDYMKKKKKLSKREKRNGVKKCVPTLPNHVASKIKYSRFVGNYDYESDSEINAKFEQKKQKAFDKLRETKKSEIKTSAFSVFSPWEIGSTVENLIKKGIRKWNCSYAESKYKLKLSLWKLDEKKTNENIDNELKLTRNKSSEWMNNIANDNDMYNMTEIEEIELSAYNFLSFTCPICLELSSMKCGIKLHCAHRICFVCLSSYVYNQINSGESFIKCPQYECESHVSECVVAITCDGVTYIRYRHFLRNSFMSTSRGWKYCPDPKCGSIIKTRVDMPLIVCQCNMPLCSLCMCAYHWPLTCQQTIEWLRWKETKFAIKHGDHEMPRFEIKLDFDTKDCPKCESAWEKNGGCNHISCRVCGYEFCWICLANWKTHGTSYFKCVQSVNKEKQFNHSILSYDDNAARHKWKLWRKNKIKASMQHDNATFFLDNKYLKNEKKLRNLFKNIKKATDKTTYNTKKNKKKCNIEFMRELIGRLIQSHLVISRGWRYVTFNNLKNSHIICKVIESLEVVAYKLDVMFIEKKFLSFIDCKWAWYDLMYYMDMFARECYAHLDNHT